MITGNSINASRSGLLWPRVLAYLLVLLSLVALPFTGSTWAAWTTQSAPALAVNLPAANSTAVNDPLIVIGATGVDWNDLTAGKVTVPTNRGRVANLLTGKSGHITDTAEGWQRLLTPLTIAPDTIFGNKAAAAWQNKKLPAGDSPRLQPNQDPQQIANTISRQASTGARLFLVDIDDVNFTQTDTVSRLGKLLTNLPPNAQIVFISLADSPTDTGRARLQAAWWYQQDFPALAPAHVDDIRRPGLTRLEDWATLVNQLATAGYSPAGQPATADTPADVISIKEADRLTAKTTPGSIYQQLVRTEDRSAAIIWQGSWAYVLWAGLALTAFLVGISRSATGRLLRPRVIPTVNPPTNPHRRHRDERIAPTGQSAKNNSVSRRSQLRLSTAVIALPLALTVVGATPWDGYLHGSTVSVLTVSLVGAFILGELAAWIAGGWVSSPQIETDIAGSKSEKTEFRREVSHPEIIPISTPQISSLRPSLIIFSWILSLLLADIYRGAPLQSDLSIGVFTVLGGRFYGANNTVAALVTLSSLTLTAALGARLSRWGALAIILPVGVGMVYVEGSANLGADLGGIPMLALGFLLLAAGVSGVRLRWKTLLLTGVGALTITASLAIIDSLRPVNAQTHLGRFVTSLTSGTAGGIIAGKLEVAAILLAGGMAAVTAIGGIIFLLMVARSGHSPRQVWEIIGHDWRLALTAVEQLPRGKITGVAILAAALIGTALNDSSFVVLAVMLILAGMLWIQLSCSTPAEVPEHWNFPRLATAGLAPKSKPKRKRPGLPWNSLAIRGS